MSTLKNLFLLGISACILFSCNPKSSQNTKPVDSAKIIADSLAKLKITYDTATDDVVSFLAGMEHGNSGCLPKLDSITRWKKYSETMNTMFADIKSKRLDKMADWADTELVDHRTTKTLFYPFSGPDFLNANIFYPNADTYIMIALEPVGELPSLCKMHKDSVNNYYDDLNRSLSDIFKRSYFITMRMLEDLRWNSVNGTIPLITLFMKRTGHHIVSIKPAGIDSNSRLVISDTLKKMKNMTRGVRIEFTTDSCRKLQTLYYFRTDLSDKGIKNNPSFKKYLDSLPSVNTYLKAASYLLHHEEFTMMRNFIFGKSDCILQDDSGIAYKFFDKDTWKIKLYGTYTKPKKEFGWIDEPDLAKAYKETNPEPLPYILGYNWHTKYINMLYAVKKNKK